MPLTGLVFIALGLVYAVLLPNDPTDETGREAVDTRGWPATADFCSRQPE